MTNFIGRLSSALCSIGYTFLYHDMHQRVTVQPALTHTIVQPLLLLMNEGMSAECFSVPVATLAFSFSSIDKKGFVVA